MNRALIIYDLTGTVIAIYWGDDCPVPNGIPYVWADIPENATVERVDLETGQPVFSVPIPTDLGQIQNRLNELDENYEKYVADVSATQLAITELYEMMLGGGVE